MKALAIIGLGVLLAAPPPALAQPAGRTLRIAILDDASEKTREPVWQAFRARMRQLGYVEGKNLVIDVRYARGATERLPALAAELVALKPDAILAAGTVGTQAAVQATSRIPVVFTGIGDPVGSGLVKSLARPGGNATGLSIVTGEIGVKWLQLMRELAPGAKRLAYLTDTRNPGSVLVFKRLQDEGRKLDVVIEMFAAHQRQDLERSLETIARERYAGIIVGNSSGVLDHRQQIVRFAAQHKLPAVYARREYADAGGLVSYGADQAPAYARMADYVHRIVQGAKPAELPVESPSNVRMVLNLKTSRTLGIAVPQSVRHRADELID